MSLPSLLVPVEQQALRVARLFGATLVTQLVAISGPVDRAVVISAVVAAAEATWKEVQAQVKQYLLSKNGVVDTSGDPTVGTGK